MSIRSGLPHGYDAWKTASPYDEDCTEEGDITKCARCNRDLEDEHQHGNPCDDPQFNYIDRGYCSGICEALALRDQFKTIGAFTDEQGLDAEVWLEATRLMWRRKYNR